MQTDTQLLKFYVRVELNILGIRNRCIRELN